MIITPHETQTVFSHYQQKLISPGVTEPLLVFCLYLVSAAGDVRSQSLHLTLEDVVFLHFVLHRRQVLAKALVVQVVLDRKTKQHTLVPFITC